MIVHVAFDQCARCESAAAIRLVDATRSEKLTKSLGQEPCAGMILQSRAEKFMAIRDDVITAAAVPAPTTADAERREGKNCLRSCTSCSMHPRFSRSLPLQTPRYTAQPAQASPTEESRDQKRREGKEEKKNVPFYRPAQPPRPRSLGAVTRTK